MKKGVRSEPEVAVVSCDQKPIEVKRFRARSMNLCLVGRHPFSPNGGLPGCSGPERDLRAPVPALSRALLDV